MNYDFIEIGTSDFDALIQKATDVTVGLSIEPLGHYLDRLPSPARVRKLCAAVNPANLFEEVFVYWISDEVIAKHGLPDWLRGCNSINRMHPQHLGMNIQHLVRVSRVPSLPISCIWTINQVNAVQLLKLDTEGCDADILIHLHQHLAQTGLPWPRNIIFESNCLTQRAKVDQVVTLYAGKGYVTRDNGNDVTMTLA